MIEIIQARRPALKFKDEHEVAAFCETSFQGLSHEVVASLRESLDNIPVSGEITPSLAAALDLEATRRTVKEIEKDSRAKHTAIHVLGHLALMLIHLPRLKRLASPNWLTSITSSGILKPKGFTEKLLAPSTFAESLADGQLIPVQFDLRKVLKGFGSLHIK